MKLVVVLSLLVLAACSRDEDGRKLLADMTTFQEAVTAALRDSPDEAGVAKAEALVAAQSGPLHARYMDVTEGKLSAGVLMMIPTRCAGNAQAAQLGEGYVKNAFAKPDADAALRSQLLSRTKTLRLALDAICKP